MEQSTGAILATIARLIDPVVLIFGAAIATAATIAAQRFGYIVDYTSAESVPIILFLFFSSCCACIIVRSIAQKVGAALSSRRYDRSIRDEGVRNLYTLYTQQKQILFYLKAHKRQRFQAPDLFDDVMALESMRIITGRQSAGPRSSVYEVPQHVWDRLPPSEEALKHLTIDHLPWEEPPNSDRGVRRISGADAIEIITSQSNRRRPTED